MRVVTLLATQTLSLKTWYSPNALVSHFNSKTYPYTNVKFKQTNNYLDTLQ